MMNRLHTLPPKEGESEKYAVQQVAGLRSHTGETGFLRPISLYGGEDTVVMAGGVPREISRPKRVFPRTVDRYPNVPRLRDIGQSKLLPYRPAILIGIHLKISIFRGKTTE